MTPEKYFKSVQSVNKKRYDALHDFFVNHLSASEVAAKYGYTLLIPNRYHKAEINLFMSKPYFIFAAKFKIYADIKDIAI